MFDPISRALHSDGYRGLPDGRREAVIQWRPDEPDREWDLFWPYVGAQVRQNIFHPGDELGAALEGLYDEGVRTAEITRVNEYEVGLESEFVGWDFTITWTPVERCRFCGGTECCGAGDFV